MPSQVHPLKVALAVLQGRAREQRSQRTESRGFSNPRVVDLFIENTPKGALSKDDVCPPTMQALKKKYKHEMSLPPEQAKPVDRVELVGTLEVTQVQTDRLRKSLSSGHGDEDVMGAMEIGVRQRYSSASVGKLERISASELLVRKVHKGKYLLCRTICSATYDAGIGILLAVEDPHGDAAYVKLFHHPMLMDATCDELDAILIPVGTVLVIREPYYVGGAFCGPAGMPYIKVDSPSDMVFMDAGQSILGDVSWTTELVHSPPTGLRRPVTGEDWKARGKMEFREGHWFSSAVCFTKCVESGFDVQLSHLNRSEVYLRLGWNSSAYLDAKRALEIGTLEDDMKRKAVVRMLKAQYASDQYDAVLEIASSFSKDDAISEWAKKAEKRKAEQKSGNFDWIKLLKESFRPDYSPDIGDFVGPIEIRHRDTTPNVRGSFVTRDVREGELLIFQKPVCSYSHRNNADVPIQIDHVPTGRTCCSRAIYHFFGKVVQKMWDDKNAYATIRALYGDSDSTKPNDFPPPLENNPTLAHPMQSVADIDIEYIFNTVLANSFGCQNLTPSGSDSELERHGLYSFASLLNHSCVPNAHRFFIGDAIVIRALRSLKKGEEVTISYISPRSFDERRIRLMCSWGFNCTCELCEAERRVDFDIREKRRKLASTMESIAETLESTYGSGPLRRLAAKAKAACDEMKQTYASDHPIGPEGINLKPELAEALRIYSNILEAQGQMDSDLSFIKRSIELKIDSLELDGLHVNDRSLTGRICTAAGKKKTRLPVRLNVLSRYHEICVITIFQIVEWFDVLGEKERAQRWFDVVLQMEILHKGGGKAVFELKHDKSLTVKDLRKYL